MPEPRDDRAVAAQEPADRERDAGLRGAELTRATWLLGAVFLVGFAIVVAVLFSRRKR